MRSLGILLLIFGIIFIKNFPFESWYTGWDNLHPEFNFWLNLKRGFFAIWQENQGLGTMGGHGYAATLPHTVILWILSFFIPMQYLRAVFTFVALLVGALGMFFLIRKLLKNFTSSAEKQEKDLQNIGALIGGLFYLLNLATVEQFYIQFEPFIVHYALLPWLFFSLISYLEQKTKKTLFFFFLVSLLSTIQGFIPPLFLVYLLLLGVFLLFYLSSKPSTQRLKGVILIFFLTLVVNAYWLLPVSYYALTKSTTYLEAYNNLSSTEDFILKNKKYGNLHDVVLLRGFILEAIDVESDGKITYIFDGWRKHLEQKSVQYTGFLFFSIILVGVVGLLHKRSKHYAYPAFFICILIVFSLLASNVFPFSLLSNLLQEIPIMKQAFRVAFTKFSISLAFLYAIGFALGTVWGLTFILKFLKLQTKRIMLWLISGLGVTLLFYFSLPVFTGNLLYERAKLNIPNVYFEMFEFFKGQDKKSRIANFPQGWNWGWSIYRWGYSGSGFLWYGIEQPIMDRAFDVWGKSNENYYWELTYAIYSENFPLVEKVLEKYHISWIIFDKNIIPYPNSRGFLYADRLEEYLEQSKKIEKVRVFKSNAGSVRDIVLYRVHLDKTSQNLQAIYEINEVKNIGPTYSFTNYDQAFEGFGHYYTSLGKDENFEIYFPFRTLFTNRSANELPIKIVDNDKTFTFQTYIPKEMQTLPFLFPSADSEFAGMDAFIDTHSDSLVVTFPKISQLGSYKSEDDTHFLNHKASTCKESSSPGKIKQEVVDEKNLRFTSFNSENCYSIILDSLPQQYAYLVIIENRNIKGKSLRFALINQDSRKADIELTLPKRNNFGKDYVIVAPMKRYGLGYSLTFNNISIGAEEAINDLKSVAVYPVPFRFLTSIKIINPSETPHTNNKILVHYQSFDSGWQAYEIQNSEFRIQNFLATYFPFFFGQKLNNHVLVNNWANGWILEPDSQGTIVLVFWPQYLEYLGFGLMGVTLFYLIKVKISSSSSWWAKPTD